MMADTLKEKNVTCDLCGQDRHRSISTRGRFDEAVQNVICLNCGLAYINPRRKSEDYSKEYYEKYSGDEAPGPYVLHTTRNYGREQYDLFAKYLPPTGGIVLDIGCGFGAQLKLIAENRTDLTLIGVEPSAAFAEYARKSMGLDGVIAGEWHAVRDTYESNSLDFIILSHVLEHFESPTEVLSGLWTLLKPEGRLFIEVPDLMRPYGKLSSFFQGAHLYTFTADTLTGMLRKTGFEVLELVHGRFSFLRAVAKKIPTNGKDTASTGQEKQIDSILDFLNKYNLLTESANNLSSILEDTDSIKEPGLLLPCAETLEQKGRLNEAEKILTRLLSIDNRYTEAYIKLADVFNSQNRKSDTEKLLSQAIKLIPRNEALHFALAENYMATGNRTDAREHYLQALSLQKKPNPIIYQRLAEVYLDEKHLDEARDILEKGLEETESTNTDLLFYLGRVFMEKREYRAAIDSFEKVIEADPSILRAYRRLAETHRHLGELDEAVGAARKGLEQDPNDPETLFLLGTLHFESNSVEESIQHFLRALEIDHKHRNSAIYLGNIYFQQRAFQKAQRYLSDTLLSGEVDPETLKLLLRTCIILGEPLESSIYPERQAGRIETDHEILTLFTGYYLSLGDRPSALKWLRTWKSESGLGEAALWLHLFRYLRRDIGSLQGAAKIMVCWWDRLRGHS